MIISAQMRINLTADIDNVSAQIIDNYQYTEINIKFSEGIDKYQCRN